MIKLRVEWRHDCPDCGTQIVVDFINEQNGACVCPWCGRLDESDSGCVSDSMRQYVLEAVRQIESTVNEGVTIPG